jgi:hypothetical protein
MGHHDYLRLEGGENLIKFIVQQCSLPNVRLRVE